MPRVQLRRLVVLCLALLAWLAAPAAASSVTSLAFTPSTWAGGASATWVFRFVPHATFQNVDVQLPPGSDAVAAGALMEPYLGGASRADVTETPGSLIRLHWNGTTFPAGREVALVVAGVVNPPAGADGAAITLNTGADADPVHPTGPGGPDSSALGRGAGDGKFTAAAPGRVTMTASSRRTGGLADWTYEFTPSEPMDTDHTITLSGHSGTVFDPAGEYLVAGTPTHAVSVDPSGRQVTVAVPRNTGRNRIQVIARGVRNPTLEGLHGNSPYALFTTSISGHRSDLPTARPANIAFAANPAPTAVDDLTAIDYTPPRGVPSTVIDFFTSGSDGRLIQGDTTIRISSKDQVCGTSGCHPFFSDPATRCIPQVLNATTGELGATACGVVSSGQTTLSFPSPVTAFPGDEIVIRTGTQASSQGSTTVSVSTTTDPHQVSTVVAPLPGGSS